jgi:flavodoxin short chain
VERQERKMIQVVYWSQGGNTQAMAEAVGKGIVEGGKEANVVSVDAASIDALKEADVFALGCPAMGSEVLEESEMEPFVSQVEGFAKGKKIALFGSFGWGDGQWMRDWVDRMNAAGAMVLGGEGVICQEAPDDDALAQCVALGRQLATA